MKDRNSAVCSYHYATLSTDFERFAKQELSRDNQYRKWETRGRVADGPMWIDANIDSFQRLLKPLSKISKF